VALYSLQHSGIAASDGIGKTAARLGYICCNRQHAIMLGERHGLAVLDRPNLRALAERHEAMAGRNGRIAECFIIALPRESNPDQHQTIVRDFAEKVTHGTAPWIAAIHYDRPGNPHVHLVALEQNKPRTGGKGRPSKVIGLSRKGALEWVREEWAETHNRLMAGTGPPIDHRSLAAQGKGHLLPMLHEGPAPRAMQARGARPDSHPKPIRGGRVINWRRIDEGRTRSETNAMARRINDLAAQLQEQSHEPRSDRVFSSPAGERGTVPTNHGTGRTADAGTPRRNERHDRSMRETSGTDREHDCGRDRTAVPGVPRATTIIPLDSQKNGLHGSGPIPVGPGLRMDDGVTPHSWRYATASLRRREQELTRLIRDGWDTMRAGIRQMISTIDWSRVSPLRPRPQRDQCVASLSSWPSAPLPPAQRDRRHEWMR